MQSKKSLIHQDIDFSSALKDGKAQVDYPEIESSLAVLQRINKGIANIRAQQLRERYRLNLHTTTNEFNYRHGFYGSLLETAIFILAALFQVNRSALELTASILIETVVFRSTSSGVGLLPRLPKNLHSNGRSYCFSNDSCNSRYLQFELRVRHLAIVSHHGRNAKERLSLCNIEWLGLG